MAFSSGIIPNTEGISLQVFVNNDNPNNQAVVELELFYLATNGQISARIPFVHQLFSVDPNQEITRTFGISIFSGFEVQFNVTGASPSDVNITAFTMNELGFPIAAQRVLQAEYSKISAITPVP